MSLVQIVAFTLPVAIAIGYFLGYRSGKDRALRDNAFDGLAGADDPDRTPEDR